jgi:hypothetical protein
MRGNVLLAFREDLVNGHVFVSFFGGVIMDMYAQDAWE